VVHADGGRCLPSVIAISDRDVRLFSSAAERIVMGFFPPSLRRRSASPADGGRRIVHYDYHSSVDQQCSCAGEPGDFSIWGGVFFFFGAAHSSVNFANTALAPVHPLVLDELIIGPER